MKFRIKQKTFLYTWLIFTIILTFVLTSGVLIYGNVEKSKEAETIDIDKIAYGLPEMKVFEREVEVVKKVENVNYKFPFKVSEFKNINAVGVCNCCLPSKKYPDMKSNSDVTVYASPDFYKEGSLIWIEGIGIRQVQPLAVSSDKLHIYFGSHEEAEKFGNKSVKMCDILE